VVGDENQAIYGFAGADIGGVGRLEKELSATDRGLMVMPLTVTRRCSKAVVQEAKKYVPEFEAHPSNSEGQVLHRNYMAANVEDQLKDEKWFAPMVQVGDRVICRSNAPLVGAAFMLIRLGKRVQILGRSIGFGLMKLVKDMKANNIPELIHNLGEWYHVQCTKERAKRIPNETKIQGWQDRRDCIIFFCENTEAEGEAGIEEVTAKIKDMFDDDEKHQTVIMSSVHKAKGLEAHRVFVLKPNSGRKPKKGWQVHEERCIGWVSVTRAIDTLVYVNWPEKKQQSQLNYEE
jgi:superfamily I DNA/RNA helicase